ncbi:hypothetical protein [Virgisporangium aurantiacum]|uniref:Uncharacterized protein n=1 Tax=Virgisporangium aurantiacum TaxID=175570 RepID=A0A8J3ZL14_9ACTN|nr:hypothetical protein [Virgisporangium aurantiacum]GIJ64743.1 hypothetical protein Vau01_122590 [Virgisporangium aurantiacum]
MKCDPEPDCSEVLERVAELFRTSAEQLFRRALVAVGGDHAAANDLVQEVFQALLVLDDPLQVLASRRAAEQIRPQTSKVVSWINRLEQVFAADGTLLTISDGTDLSSQLERLRNGARPGDVLLVCVAHTRSAEAVETLKTAQRIGLTTWAVVPRPARAIAREADDLIEVDCSPDLIESAYEAILRIVDTLVDGDIRRFDQRPERKPLAFSPPQVARPAEGGARTALLNARSIAATTLRDVLRELYPAALRAYPDPTEPIPLAILEALPEPGTVDLTAAHRWKEAAAALADAGVADIETLTDQITSLLVAIAETPRRVGDTALSAATAHTVRQSIAAVRACDKAIAALALLPAGMTSSPNRVAAAPVGRTREGRVRPPWQADDLPDESPTLRLVEPAAMADPFDPPGAPTVARSARG